MPEPMKFGVLSTAQIARRQHIPAAAESDLCEIVSISSRDLSRAQEYAKELNIPKAFGSYDEVLSDAEIDAVINPLPNNMHHEWTIKAAEAGKHILCEKPLAMTPEECQEMIDACKANGVRLFEGFTQHFNPMLIEIAQMLKEGAIGDVKMMKSTLTYPLPNWDTDVRGLKELGGGALFDAGCYCVNTIRTLMGDEPECVQAFQSLHPQNQVESNFMGLMQFPGGRLAQIGTGQEHIFTHTLEIIGATGSLSTPNVFAGSELTVNQNGKTETRTYEPVNRFKIQIEHFVDCVRNNKPFRAEPEDGKANVATLVALKQSANEGGQTITL